MISTPSWSTVVIAVAVGTVAVTGCSGSDSSSATETTTFTLVDAEVRRGDLTAEREFTGSVTHGEVWSLNTVAAGTVTSSHPAGTVVNFGDEIIGINDQPIVLAEGAVPMYRELYNPDSTTPSSNTPAADQTPALDPNADPEAATQQPTTTTTEPPRVEGDDVIELQTFLISQGFDDEGRLKPDGKFGARTESAVKAWQKSRGLPETGRIDTAQLVFAPRPVRINTELRVGSTYAGLDVTPAEPAVTLDTSNRDRSVVKVDTVVEIDDGDGNAISGTVTKQENKRNEMGESVWTSTITPDAALPDGAETVTITVVEKSVEDALLVPVSALLALSEGGFAVEIPDGEGTKLIAVDLEDVVEGTAAISGDLAEGDTVLIPE